MAPDAPMVTAKYVGSLNANGSSPATIVATPAPIPVMK